MILLFVIEMIIFYYAGKIERQNKSTNLDNISELYDLSHLNEMAEEIIQDIERIEQRQKNLYLRDFETTTPPQWKTKKVGKKTL